MRARKKSPLRWFRRNLGRPALLLLFTAALMSAVVAWWPRSVRGMPEEHWNQVKLDWRAEADLLILGDSRGASSLLPRVMSEVLPGVRIKNFSFPGNAYLPEYIPAGLRVLDPATKAPQVVMAFSSKTLTPNLEGYPAAAKRSWSMAWKWRHIPELMTAFEPVTKWQFINTLRGEPDLGFWREFRDDGSYIGGARWKNRRPTVDDAVNMLGKQRVEEKIIADVLRHVRELTGRGVLVYGVRLPSSTEIENVEDTTQHFDEAAFTRRFVDAGGRWVAIPDRNAYATYDLSHLEVADAERFSRWFAEQLRDGPAPLTITSSAAQGLGTTTATLGATTSTRAP